MKSKLAGAVAAFCEHLLAAGHAARTREDYRATLRGLTAFLTTHKVVRVADVTPRHLVAYQRKLMAVRGARGPLSLYTQANRLICVRQFFRWLARTGRVLADPTMLIDMPKVNPRLPSRVPSVADMRRLIQTPCTHEPLGVRDRAMLEVLYSTGLRVTELANLAVDAIDLAGGEVSVRQGKGGRDRRVPIGEAACFWVSRYLTTVRPVLARRRLMEAALFLSCRGRKLTRHELAVMVRDYARTAGLSYRVSPHSIRHACATHLLRGRASLRHVQEILGHTKLSSTQIYTRVDLTDLKAVHRRCHPRGRG